MKSSFFTLVLTLILLSGSALAQSPVRISGVHCSPDPAASPVDVYFGIDTDNIVAKLDDVSYLNAGFYDTTLSASVTIQSYLAPSNSTAPEVENNVGSLTVEPDNNYLVFFYGLVESNNGYDTTGKSLAAEVLNLSSGNEPGNDEVAIAAFHAAFEVPEVRAIVSSSGEVTTDPFGYGAFTDISVVSLDDYVVHFTSAQSGDTLATYDAPLETAGLGGQSVVLYAHGFNDQAIAADYGNNGFGVNAYVPSADTTISLSPVTSIDDRAPFAQNGVSVYPNPTNGSALHLSFELDRPASRTQVRIFDLTGRILKRQNLGQLQPGSFQEQLDISTFNNGAYILEVSDEQGVSHQRFQVTR